MPLVSKSFSDIITFTRASSATYFDSAGVLQTATTDVPRFDYDPSTLAAQGLLIEESRTNLALQSEDFSNTTVWANSAGTVTRNANVEIAPDGTQTADELVFAAADNNVAQSITILNGTAYAVSIWMKGVAGETIRFTANNVPGGSNVTLSGQWQRFTFSGTSTGTSATINIGTFGGVTARNVYVWGAQLEVGSAVFNSGTASGTTTAVVLSAGSATDDVYNGMVLFVNGEYRTITDYVGSTKTATVAALTASPTGAYVVYSTSGSASFPTSYIPTTTSAVTRAADVASVNTLSPWYNAAEGTLYAEVQRYALIPSGAFYNAWSISDNTNNERFIGYNTGSTQGMDAGVTDGGSPQATLSAPGAITANTTVKTAFAYAVNNFAFVRDAGVVQTDTSGTLPIVSRLYIGANSVGAGQWTSYIRRITYWPRRLANSELQAVTS